ncbi:hypothetical protein C0J52_24615 [Blattella germanica]|nr:hypothetical protein C0J52_24615 [Blattella germanica]
MKPLNKFHLRSNRLVYHRQPPTRSIYQWINKLKQTGSVLKGNTTGRPRVSDERVEEVRDAFASSPKSNDIWEDSMVSYGDSFLVRRMELLVHYPTGFNTTSKFEIPYRSGKLRRVTMRGPIIESIHNPVFSQVSWLDEASPITLSLLQELHTNFISNSNLGLFKGAESTLDH